MDNPLNNWVAVYRGYSTACARVERALNLELDMTLPQFHSLLYLRDASPCRNTDLAHYLVRTAQTMTGVIDRLVERRWAAREKHPKDRRAILVRVLPAGLKALEKAIPIVEEAYPSAVGKLSEAQQTMLVRLAAALADGA